MVTGLFLFTPVFFFFVFPLCCKLMQIFYMPFFSLGLVLLSMSPFSLWLFKIFLSWVPSCFSLVLSFLSPSLCFAFFFLYRVIIYIFFPFKYFFSFHFSPIIQIFFSSSFFFLLFSFYKIVQCVQIHPTHLSTHLSI
ncbi:hypothetical protein DFH27DRAFT_215783 [Peziza echinospora]|nr:hypothetical protein DFH27DRAFT_215783 [Peziza echinospora]